MGFFKKTKQCANFIPLGKAEPHRECPWDNELELGLNATFDELAVKPKFTPKGFGGLTAPSKKETYF